MSTEQMTLPKMLKYKSIKPKGMPSRCRRVEVNQMNNQQSFSFNDIIRFQFQTDSFIDPYQSYIELQVEVPQDAAENMPKTRTFKKPTDLNATGDFNNEQTVTYPDFSNVPLYLLDGPATCFISEMIMYSNGKEIERIQEYDQLGNLMADLGIEKNTRAKGGYYGLASSFGKSDYSYLTHQLNNRNRTNDRHDATSLSFSNTLASTTAKKEQTSYILNNSIPLTYANDNFSLLQNYLGDAASFMFQSQQQMYKSPINDYLDIQQVTSNKAPNVYLGAQLDGSEAGHHMQEAALESALKLNIAQSRSQQYNDQVGIYNTTLTNQYLDILSGKKSSDAKVSQYQLDPIAYINYAREFALQDGQFGIEHFDTISSTPFVNQKQARQEIFGVIGNRAAKVASSILNNLENQVVENDAIDYSNNPSVKRRKKILYNSASNQNNFTYFAPGIAQTRWKDGQPVTDFNFGGSSIATTNGKTDCEKEVKYGMTKKTFYIPILSGIIGHLIPCDQWKLIPGKGCGVMNWEFRLNRHAIYMSGHKKYAEDQPNLSSYDSQFHNGRTGWKVNKISLHFDLWDFPESVNEIVNQQLKEGIIMNSQAFISGPTYSIQNTNALKGSWQINNSIQSLKKLYFWFLLDDYQAYNYCRKSFRISHNLKSVQLKLGQEFIPEQPIKGHAGNLIEFNGETTKDYLPFYLELLRAHGEMFQKEGNIQILPQNFIVNDRAYNPSDIQATQFQTAFLHETRLCGKSVFTIDMEADPFDFDTISGKNIAEVKPVELVLDVHTQGAQNRPSTMFTLLHADALVQFSLDGIQVAT